MNEYELIARNLHKSGSNCSNAIYMTFKEKLYLNEESPKPRSIDGLCGAVLTAEYILKKLGKEFLIDDFRKDFISKFKYLKCLELMKNGRLCNDYVGFVAKFISKYLEDI